MRISHQIDQAWHCYSSYWQQTLAKWREIFVEESSKGTSNKWPKILLRRAPLPCSPVMYAVYPMQRWPVSA